MPTVLTLNGGSSSIRFAFFDAAEPSTKLLDGKIDRIGMSGTTLAINELKNGARQQTQTEVDAADHRSAGEYLMERLASLPLFATVGAIGHRVVHGMKHSSPERITPDLLAELRRITPYDPEHLPREIELIEAVGRRHPDLPQAACFDTAFHRTMPRVATILPLPRRYESKGVQRYGFHGLSYTYLMGELSRQGDRAAARGRVILAHLGNGASMAAVRDGRCIDTSMGFTPTAGLVMSTRTGDLDPGVMTFLASTESMDAAAYEKMVTHESGLLGVSETSSDVRDLLAREADDIRAAEAIALFATRRKNGSVRSLPLSAAWTHWSSPAAIGENAAAVRARICAGLEFLGLELDEARNAQNAAVISAESARVVVRVLRTDEESVIAKLTIGVLGIATTEE